MVLRLSRRDALRFGATAFGLATAGCLGEPIDGNRPRRTEERALSAEEAFLTERFRNASCLTNWGVSPKSPSTQTVIVERTAEEVRVEVTLTFYYTTEDLEVDGASNALYVVTVDSTERVRGDEISPC